MYIVDSSDKERMDIAAEELHHLLNEPALDSAIFIIMANKQDLPDAAGVGEVARALKLDQVYSRKWHIQGTSVMTGEGLYEGLDWISNNIK